jgi:hypothetical protein
MVPPEEYSGSTLGAKSFPVTHDSCYLLTAAATAPVVQEGACRRGRDLYSDELGSRTVPVIDDWLAMGCV